VPEPASLVLLGKGLLSIALEAAFFRSKGFINADALKASESKLSDPRGRGSPQSCYVAVADAA